MRLLSWNLNRPSARRATEQARALVDRAPDVVALQEVTAAGAAPLLEVLVRGGLLSAAAPVPAAPVGSAGGARALGLVLASRWPVRPVPPDDAGGTGAPWPERLLSVAVAACGVRKSDSPAAVAIE
jgi:hypothetical protein